MERPQLTISPRKITGKKVKSLRQAGRIPGILYGHEVEPTPVELGTLEFAKLFKEAGSNTIVKLLLDKEDRNALIQEVAHDPVSGSVLHVDLYQVNMKEKITAEVPIQFIDEAPAVRELDGTLVTNRDEIEVECLPADLPKSFEVDLSVLDSFDKSIKVGDIKASLGVLILTDPEETIAFVEEPRSEEELAELEEAPAEGEMPEVAGEVAPGEEEAEEAEGEEKKSPPAGGEGEEGEKKEE